MRSRAKHANQWSDPDVVRRRYARALARLARRLGHTPCGREILAAKRSGKAPALPWKSTWNLRFGCLRAYQIAANLVPNGRGGSAGRALTHCRLAGHPMTSATVYSYRAPDGHQQRICKACHKVRVKRHRKQRELRALRVARFSAAELAARWTTPGNRRVIRFAEASAA